MVVTGDSVMSDKNDDIISPYLLRPLRSLREYLKEAAQRGHWNQRGRSDENARPQPVAEDGSRGEEK
jgi:hypothetical protein